MRICKNIAAACLIAALTLALAVPACAADYTVRKGDSLWKIAKEQLGSGTLWTELYEANKNRIKDPNLIYAGQVLTIPGGEETPAEPVTPTEPATPAEAVSYTYEYTGMIGAETAQFDLKTDGTCLFSLPGNPMVADTYSGAYTRDGNTVTITNLTNVDASSAFATPALWSWIVDGNATITVDDAAGTFMPEGADENSGLPGLDVESDADIPNVAYASNSSTQVMDIYLPENPTGSDPVIVLVHGGGFAFGSQTMEIIRPVIEAGVANGYVVASVDYRKSGESAFPGALSDVKAAVRYLRANADEYGIDPERVVIWGESAGAYLSLMTALTPEVDELNGDVTENPEQSSAVSVLVSFYAPVEFWTMDDEYIALGKTDSSFSSDSSFESKFVGQAIGEDEEMTYTTWWGTYENQLPEDFTLRAWIQAGDSDNSVPYTQSKNFAAKLAEVIGEDNVRFGILEGADHEDDAFYTDENLSQIFAFLADTLG